MKIPHLFLSSYMLLIFSSFTFVIPNQSFAFSYLLGGDTQFYWSKKDAGGDEEKEGLETNSNQVKAMNSVTQYNPYLQQANLVLLLGDLTAYGHDYQWDVFFSFYKYGNSTKYRDQLRLPLFWGLGNHDYANNTPQSPGQGCYTWTNAFLGYYGCARHGLRMLNEFVKDHKNASSTAFGIVPAITNSDTHDAYNLVGGKASWAYSWNQEGYHFVQLNNYPTYTNDGIDVKSAVSWLKADLDANPNQKVVLLMHDGVEHWDINDAGFVDAIRGHKVVAIFTSHVHSLHGWYDNHISSGRTIPVFFTGSSPWNTFLHVRFEPNLFTVTELDAGKGYAQLLAMKDYSV